MKNASLLMQINRVLLGRKLIMSLLSLGKSRRKLKAMLKPKEIPNFKIESKHIRGCELVANRIELLKRLPKQGMVAELGVDEGYFSDLIVEYCTPQKLHLVDTWSSRRYDDGKFSKVTSKFKTKIEGGAVEIHRRLSIEASLGFDDYYFDWIYIDTDHRYRTTLDELYAFSKKVKKGGLIAGHDYVMGNWSKSIKYGVVEAVAEFCVKENWRIKYLTADYTENQSFALQQII